LKIEKNAKTSEYTSDFPEIINFNKHTMVDFVKEKAQNIEFKCAMKDNYQLTGWLEFAIRAIATGTGIVSLVIALVVDSSIRIDLYRAAVTFDWPRIVIVVLLAVLVLFSLFVLVMRTLGGDIFSVIFYITVVVAHVFMLITEISSLSPAQYFFVFILLNCMAEVIHYMWIQIRDEADVAMTGPFPKKDMALISIFLTVLYFIGIAMQVILWIWFYEGDTGI